MFSSILFENKSISRLDYVKDTSIVRSFELECHLLRHSEIRVYSKIMHFRNRTIYVPSPQWEMYLWLEKGDPTRSVDIVRLVSDAAGERDRSRLVGKRGAAPARDVWPDRLSKEVEAIVSDPNTNPGCMPPRNIFVHRSTARGSPRRRGAASKISRVFPRRRLPAPRVFVV